MKETSRIKLPKAEVGEDFSTFDYVYSDARDIIDEILAKVQHSHLPETSISDPVSAVSGALLTTDANLSAGDYYYTYSWVNDKGETKYAPELLISNGIAVPPPIAPELTEQVGGGTLFGDYYYYLTRVKGSLETSLGEPGRISLSALAAVEINYYEYLSNIDNIKIYRRRADSPIYYLLATIPVSASPNISYTDTGDGTEAEPPNYNQTEVAKQVQLTTPNAPVGVQYARFYRRAFDDTFEEYALIAEAAATSGSPVTYTDSGSIIRLQPPRKINTTGSWTNQIDLLNETINSLIQTRVEESAVYNDSYPLSGTPANLEEDLNKIRSAIKLITGEANWDDEPSLALKDISFAAGVSPYQNTYYCSFSPTFQKFWFMESIDTLLNIIDFNIQVLDGSATQIDVKIIQDEKILAGVRFTSFPGYHRLKGLRRLNNIVPGYVYILVEQSGTASGFVNITFRGVLCQQ